MGRELEISILPLAEINDSLFEDIRELASVSRQSTVFHSGAWLKLLAEHADPNFYCAILKVDEKLAGYMGFQMERTMFGFRKLTSPAMPWATPYGGPVLSQNTPINASHFVLQCSRATGCRYSYAIAGPFSNPDEVDSLVTQTSILDLTRSEEELIQGMHSKTRNMIRRAGREGIVVRNGSRDDIPLLYEMLEETLTSRGIRTVDSDFLHKLLSSSDIDVTMQFACKNGSPLSGIVNLHCHGTSYYWLGASASGGRIHGSNELLQWEAILLAKAKGNSRYDMVRFDRDLLPGISRFKVRFGGDTLKVPVYEYRSSSWKILSRFRKFLRKVNK
ncbi:MAG: peptidoglycan bridge formation glycyltransferase FemA/FemB family protein [Sphaerochaetaceae bacterium]|nr:peptidoglycan bridge formation glycyltransferase FemA/FemB family protein [Sphaerochaetaceae bacterium]